MRQAAQNAVSAGACGGLKSRAPSAPEGDSIMRLIAVLLALLLALPAAAQSREEQARLDWVAARGRLLFDVDRAAWVTTDDFRDRLSEADQQLVRGWTVERDGTGFVVVYFMAGEDNRRRALYRGRVENRRVVSRETFARGSGPELTPMQNRIAEAYRLVSQTNARICGNSRPNLAVIPPDSLDAPMDVYVLTPQTQAGIFPFGGHSRATFSAAGALLSQRTFTNTCLDMSNQPEGGDPIAAVGVTHLLDPIPTEIHVFLSIWMALPVAVATREPRRVWMVTGDRIELVDPAPAAPVT
jgi:hypothetical protein